MSKLLSMRFAGIVFFGFFFLIPLLGTNQFHLYVATLVLIYIILTLGLNILVGYAGQLAFASAAMFGIGAYVCGLLIKHLGVSYWLAAPSGAIAAMRSVPCWRCRPFASPGFILRSRLWRLLSAPCGS
jgi:ABC-type branched-subunit amino acid transport system permease subunit